MKISKGGVTRMVFLIGNYAIKIPRLNYGWEKFIAGIYSNLSEYDCWRWTKCEYLCPVLFSFGGFILVMPKVDVFPETEDAWSEIDKAIPMDDRDDHKPNNYGRLNGKIVCIDYPYWKINARWTACKK
jgi:hypothetical protein